MKPKESQLEIKITGRIPSKKNETRKGKYGNFYNTKQPELDAIIWQLKKYKFFTGNPVRISYFINTHSHRQDFSNICQSLDDCLQKAGIISNDRQIIEFGASAITFVKDKEELAVIFLEDLNLKN